MQIQDNSSDLFLLFKIVRLYKGLEFINITRFMVKLKKIKQEKFERQIANDPELGSHNLSDYTDISSMLYLGYSLRIFKLLILITTCNYFFGMIFKVVADLECGEMNADGECQENS